MNWIASLSIRNKIIAMIVGVSASVVMIIGGLQLAWESDRAEKRLDQELSALSSLIASRSSAAIVFDDEILAHDNLKSLNLINNIIKACLYQSNGTILSGYVREGLEDNIKCEEDIEFTEPYKYFTDSQYIVKTGVLLGADNVGYLTIVSDLSPITDYLSNQIIFTIIAIIAALVASLLMALMLQKLISDPLMNITSVAQAIVNKGEFGSRAEVKGKDELGALAKAFNSMLDTLSVRNRQLMDAKDEQIEASILYRGLINSTSAIPWDLDLSTWCFTYVGKQAESVFGYPVSEWYKEKFWEDNLHPDDRESSLEYCMTSTANKQDHQFEYRLRKPDGQYVWIHDDVQVVLENDKPVRLQGFMFDITERKRQEEAIRNIAAGVSAETGEKFYKQLVIQLASLFDAKYAFIGLVSDDMTHVDTMTVSVDGAIVDNFSYALKDTPCANVIEHSTCSYPENVQALFPDDKLLAEMYIESYIGTPVFDANGDALGLIVVLDIKPMLVTDQVKEILQIFASRASAELQRTMAAEKLIEAQKKLSLHVQQTPLGVIEWDNDFKVVAWNPGAEKIFGFTSEEAIGKTGAELILTDKQFSEIEDTWSALIANKGGAFSRNENVTKDGHIIMCEWFNTSLTTDEGEVVGAASFVLDTTSEQAAQDALRLKEIEQREILNSMIDGVITIDDDGKIMFCNKATEQMFDYTEEDLIGEDIRLIVPGFFEHSNELEVYSNSPLEKNNIVGMTREISAERKGKAEFPARLSVADLKGITDGRVRYICSCQDITNEKQQEEQLQRSQKMDALGKLTGGVAHDYNNMLGVVLGYAEILEAKLTDNPKLSDYVREIRKAGDRGAKLSQKLLAFSRKKIADAEEVVINDLLLEEKNMLEKTLTARIRLEFTLEEGLWPVRVDVSDLEDAILNMSINAMHAIDGNGDITIITSNQYLSEMQSKSLNIAEGDYVVLTISDTGCGMDDETKEKVFEPFFSTKGDKGTGLGLSQVYGFIRRNNGVIKIDSETGKGSRFSLYFPRYHASSDLQHTGSTQNTQDLSGEGTILVVDDELQLLLLTAEILESSGYQVLTAKSANEALTVLENKQVDVMVTDIIMPEMDGYELASIVQKKYPGIKIQLASGYSDEKNVHLIDDDLHEALLQKPISSDKLLERVKKLLER